MGVASNTEKGQKITLGGRFLSILCSILLREEFACAVTSTLVQSLARLRTLSDILKLLFSSFLFFICKVLSSQSHVKTE